MDNQGNQGQPQDMSQAAQTGGSGQTQNQGQGQGQGQGTPTPPPAGGQQAGPPQPPTQGGVTPPPVQQPAAPVPPQQPMPGVPTPPAAPQGGMPPAGAPMPPQQPMPGAPTPAAPMPPQQPMPGMPPAGGVPMAGGTPPPTGPEPAANFTLGLMIKEIKIKVPQNNLQFDETRFLQLLAGSISLSKDEKKRIVGAIPRLSQEQVNELIRIFDEEKIKFAELSARHIPELERLAKQYAADWEDIEMSFAQNEKATEDQDKAAEIRKNLGI